MRQPVSRTPDAIVKRVQYLIARRNMTTEQAAKRLNLPANTLYQRLYRGALGDVPERLAELLGIAEEVLLDQKLTDDEVWERVARATPTKPVPVVDAVLVTLAFDATTGFGKGKLALVSTKETPQAGDLVAYSEGDGYVIRRMGSPTDGVVILLHPHVPSKTEVRKKQWAASHLRKVIALCDPV